MGKRKSADSTEEHAKKIKSFEDDRVAKRDRSLPEDDKIRYTPEQWAQYEKDLKDGKFDKWLNVPLDEKFVWICFSNVKKQIYQNWLIPEKIIPKEINDMIPDYKGYDAEDPASRQLIEAMCVKTWTIKDLDEVLVKSCIDDESDIPKEKDDIYEERIDDYDLVTELGENSKYIGIWNEWYTGDLFDKSHHLGYGSHSKSCVFKVERSVFEQEE